MTTLRRLHINHRPSCLSFFLNIILLSFETTGPNLRISNKYFRGLGTDGSFMDRTDSPKMVHGPKGRNGIAFIAPKIIILKYNNIF